MAHPANEETSVADDMLRNGYDRWARLEGEKAAISEDLKELFGELKANGLDGKALRAAFRKVAKAGDTEASQHDAVVDLYVDSLLGPRVKPSGTKVALTQARDAHEENTEHQPDPKAGSDLTTSHALDNGQVAQIPEPDATPAGAVVADTSGVTGGESAAADDGQELSVSSEPVIAIESEDSASDAGQSSSAPLYAEPGVVVWESAPPEGVARHPYSNLFGTAGQDIAVIEGDLEAANAAPIVKIGNVIIDGWARYVQARSMFTEVLEDGVTKRIPLEYPVVQYGGTDPLIDCIKWNLDGRLMTSEQKFRVAQALTRMEPKRKGDIYAAFELGMELVGA